MEEALKSAVRDVLEQSAGVEAWRDVSYKMLDDGRMYFRGTAYFKELSKLKIENQTMLEFDWAKGADGGGILSLRTNKSDEVATQTMADGSKVTVTSPKSQAASTNKLTGEELTKKIKQERAQFQQSKPMLQGFLGNMKQAVVLHLPGKVVNKSNFGTDASGALTIGFDGAKFLQAMDNLVNDDEWCREHAGTGFENMQEKPAMDDETAQLVFGEKGPVRATVSGAAPLFDYAKELAGAKAQYAKIQKHWVSGWRQAGLQCRWHRRRRAGN